MSHLFHHAALDLLDPRLTIDHNVVKAVCQKSDNFLQVGVDLAVAAGALRTAYRKEHEARHLNQRVKNSEPRLAEKLQRFSCLSVFNAVNDAHTDIVQRQLHIHAKSNGQTDGRIGVDREYLLVGVLLNKQSHYGRADRSLAYSALACYRDYLGFIFHIRPSLFWK